ncbi:hypothetical protein Barb7_02645 [Bacteroidales bacterium Barb7]|nr:hypothetical protein Barb7_02645 [Bacteroidales bacterium Barb7]
MSGTNPNVANQNVLNYKGVACLDCHCISTAGIEFAEKDFPFTLIVGNGLISRILKGDSDFFPRPGPTPNPYRGIALQHHAVTSQFGQPDLCKSRSRR